MLARARFREPSMSLTPREKHAAMIACLPEQTGRSLRQWMTLVRKHGPVEPDAAYAWLKKKHGLGGGHAGVIASELAGGPAYARKTPEQLVAAQYSGVKAALRPIHDRLVAAARALGNDVRVEPCMTYVSLMRGRQFAVVRATTKTRVDLGLALGDTPATGCLLAKPPPGTSDRITHRIALTKASQVNHEVRHWLKKASQSRVRPARL